MRVGGLWLLVLVCLCVMASFLAGCSVEPPTAAREPEALRYKELRFTPAAEAADICKQLFEIRVAFSPRLNTVVLSGPQSQVSEALQLLDRFDSMVDDSSMDNPWAVWNLKNANAKDVAAILNFFARSGAFPVSDLGARTPTIVAADSRTNSLVIYTDPAYSERLRQIIDKLDKAIAAPAPATVAGAAAQNIISVAARPAAFHAAALGSGGTPPGKCP